MFLCTCLFYAWIIIYYVLSAEEDHIKVCNSKATEDVSTHSYAIVSMDGNPASQSEWKCLVASQQSSVLTLQRCNFSDSKQLWYRKDNNTLINAFSIECLDWKNGESGNAGDIVLQQCNDSSITQKWECNRTSGCTSLTSSLLGKKYRIHVDDTKITVAPFYDPSICTGWRFIKLNNSQINGDNEKLFCKQHWKPCRPPLAGLDSFLVSPSTAASIIHDAGLFHRHEGNIVGRKSCYEHDDTVVVCCDPGYEGLEDKSPFKILTCVDGEWSDDRPVYCVKKYCGPPPKEKFSAAIGSNFRFGDVVRYECVLGYKGIPTTRLCGTMGRWVGKRPTCVSNCEFNITAESGIIRSPRYPGPYDHLRQCKWFITVPKGLKIVFWVRDFYVEPSSILTTTCHHDVFFITEGNKTLDYCGSTGPDGWISKGNNVTVGFRSDHSQAFKGFKIEFVSWNSSDTPVPIKPIRNGTFPDEEIRSHVHVSTEYARYYLEAIYVILAFLGLGCICAIIFYHVFDWGRVQPITESVTSRLGWGSRSTMSNAEDRDDDLSIIEEGEDEGSSEETSIENDERQ
ncbi:uncharacterized protein LOC120347615 [Styela clava]